MAELTITAIENENWEDKASKFIYIYWKANMRIGKIASSVEYRMHKQF